MQRRSPTSIEETANPVSAQCGREQLRISLYGRSAGEGSPFQERRQPQEEQIAPDLPHHHQPLREYITKSLCQAERLTTRGSPRE